MKNSWLLPILCCLILFSCKKPKEEKLAFMGYGETKTVQRDGKEIEENTYPSVPEFEFTNQDGKIINNEFIKDKIVIVDFFFATCPTICPVVKKNTMPLFEKYKDHPDVIFLSHSITPLLDSTSVLKNYAQGLGVDNSNWHFVRGDIEKTIEIANKFYYVSVIKNKEAPGGMDHSGFIILLDKNGKKRYRGKNAYDGQVPSSVELLMEDVQKLIDEKKENKS